MLVERSTAESQGTSTADAEGGNVGFSEPPAAFETAVTLQDIEQAENNCLEYRATNREDFLLKVDFMLGQLRELSDDHEEFDELAQIMRRDIESFTNE
ncbi:MAG: hypothetical protein K0U74_03355 [Alphaproteobacteria bacterium]|nr:hypothetical protein [Alphaproteobacteria bacterium]